MGILYSLNQGSTFQKIWGVQRSCTNFLVSVNYEKAINSSAYAWIKKGKVKVRSHWTRHLTRVLLSVTSWIDKNPLFARTFLNNICHSWRKWAKYQTFLIFLSWMTKIHCVGELTCTLYTTRINTHKSDETKWLISPTSRKLTNEDDFSDDEEVLLLFLLQIWFCRQPRATNRWNINVLINFTPFDALNCLRHRRSIDFVQDGIMLTNPKEKGLKRMIHRLCYW